MENKEPTDEQVILSRKLAEMGVNIKTRTDSFLVGETVKVKIGDRCYITKTDKWVIVPDLTWCLEWLRINGNSPEVAAVPGSESMWTCRYRIAFRKKSCVYSDPLTAALRAMVDINTSIDK